jgi:hypothetical protein
MMDDGRNFIPPGGIEPGVLGFVDHAHAAFAELGEDFVPLFGIP